MFTGDQIPELVELLTQRQVCLYHSCQLLDFKSYLKVGGIPSRKLMESDGLPFTPFVTDRQDKVNKVWDKVFLNIVDFGEIFALGRSGVPCVYGPISMRVRPAVLLQAHDVAICLMSAGKKGYCREDQALKTIQDVDRLFSYPRNWSGLAASKIKSRGGLRTEFQTDYISYPEMSCTYQEGKIPIDCVDMLIVDPYAIDGFTLLNEVEYTVQQIDSFSPKIVERPAVRHRKGVYSELAKLLLADNYPLMLKNVLHQKGISKELSEWALEATKNPDLEMQFKNFSEYSIPSTFALLMRG